MSKLSSVVVADGLVYDDVSESPVRIPSDLFEFAVWRSLIEHEVAGWTGQAPQNAITRYETVNGDLRAVTYGYLDGVLISSDAADHAIETGWVKGRLRLEWFEKNERLVCDWPDFPTSIDIEFALLEREYPSSEAYRLEVVWRLTSELADGAQTNITPYTPTLGPSVHVDHFNGRVVDYGKS